MKTPNIRNPLTAIALFVGFAETILLAVLKIVGNNEIQIIMSVSMILLTFGTVNTLYAIYKNLNTRVDMSVLDRICKALECTPGDLFEYKANEKN